MNEPLASGPHPQRLGAVFAASLVACGAASLLVSSAAGAALFDAFFPLIIAAGLLAAALEWFSLRAMRLRIGKLSVAVCFLAGCAAWLGWHFLRYREAALPGDDTFWQFFDRTTRALPSKRGPLGGEGYVLRGLQGLFFASASISGAVILTSLAWCDRCARYMGFGRTLAWLPAGLKPKLFGFDKREDERRRAEGQAAAGKVLDAVRRGDLPEAQRLLSTLADPKARGLAGRVQLGLSTCEQCGGGRLRAILLTGQGKAQRQRPLGEARVEQETVLSLDPG